MTRRQMLTSGVLLGAAAGGVLPAFPGRAQSVGGAAPEFAGIDGWINAAAPLTMAGLRGKVVLVDFWTYSCINCRRTVAYLNRWQAEYGPLGLQVIGIHTPEFGFEHARRNVDDSVREFGIRFPVGQDNGFRTWRAWSNRAWPAFYLVDRDGKIVLLREGEGYAREMEGAIRALLGLASAPRTMHAQDDPDLSRIRSPELYFGSQHSTPQDRSQSPRRGEAAYVFPRTAGPRLDKYDLDGTWLRESEALVLRSARGGMRLRFSAAKLHLVAAAPPGTAVRVRADGGPWNAVAVERPTLYTLLDGETYGEHLVELEAGGPGFSMFSATFG